MTTGLRALWLAGLAAFVTLIAAYGADDVLSAVAGVGWGLALVCALHLPPLILHTAAWAALLSRSLRRPFGTLLAFRWYGESVSSLLPVAQVGGDLLRGHLHARSGAAGAPAYAGVVVDLTTEVTAQLAFAGVALAALAWRDGGSAAALSLVPGIAALMVLVAGFYLAQRRGLFARLLTVFERLIDRQLVAGAVQARALDRTTARLYRRRGAVRRAVGLHLAGWIAGTAEVYVAAWLLDAPIGWLDAMVVEGLLVAVRAAAFMIPGALGVQEGGLILLGALVGMPPDTALALSLVKRVRELLLGLAGLLLWQRAAVAATLRGSALWPSRNDTAPR